MEIKAQEGLRVDWPDFDWVEYHALDGKAYMSLIGANAEMVRLIPIRNEVLRSVTGSRRRLTLVVSYELTVGSKSEGRLDALDPYTVQRTAEAIVRTRYPEHFRGRPNDPPPGSRPARPKTSTGGAKGFGKVGRNPGI